MRGGTPGFSPIEQLIHFSPYSETLKSFFSERAENLFKQKQDVRCDRRVGGKVVELQHTKFSDVLVGAVVPR